MCLILALSVLKRPCVFLKNQKVCLILASDCIRFTRPRLITYLGTICEHLSNKYGFGHLSAGELLREEMKREGSEYGKLISEINQAGKIVPSHITVGLLQNEINKLSSSDSSESVFLIDGFPR